MKVNKDSDFIATVTKEIEDKKKSTAGILTEITTLETEIRDLRAKIDAYTDVNDVKTYSNLKDSLEIRQHKLEVLKRQLNSETTAQDPGHIAIVVNGFISEKRKIDDEYAAEMIEIVRKLEDKLTEAEDKRESVRAIYNSWVTTFKVDPTKYQGFPGHDETGVSGNVQKLVNSLRITGKME